jgi:hypothetical protein
MWPLMADQPADALNAVAAAVGSKIAPSGHDAAADYTNGWWSWTNSMVATIHPYQQVWVHG